MIFDTQKNHRESKRQAVAIESQKLPVATERLTVKAKFHYAIWFEAGSELVRKWFEPDSVMEFGFNFAECGPIFSILHRNTPQ